MGTGITMELVDGTERNVTRSKHVSVQFSELLNTILPEVKHRLWGSIAQKTTTELVTALIMSYVAAVRN